jgi:hypothetical protein
MNDQKLKPCRFFQKGSCRFTDQECKFSHQLSENQNHSKSHVQTSQKDISIGVVADKIKYVPREKKPSTKEDPYSGSSKLHKKNTESFEPNYTPADMRVLVEVAGKKSETNLHFQSKDVVIIPDLFDDEERIHDKLLKEMDECGIDSDRLWKLWHGDTHMIADDHTNFKQKCPTFMKVLDKVRDYFGMDIKATRFNLYRDDSDFKPFHFDASAVKPDKAKIQNITIGVSFGRTRDIAFEDALEPKGHRRVVSFPLPNGYTYAFCKDINVNWRHGVPAIKVSEDKSRISIIVWGWREQDDV